jgi:YidC/Oxa1 family membrane protein insertase
MNILYTIIIYPIVIILEFTFILAQKLFKETGLSVIFISLSVSVLCLPLYAIAEKWQRIQRDISNKLKPKTDMIKKVFKGDEQYMILTTYYRQNQYHPIYALRSSFGLLIQIPFFIAAYSFLSNLKILDNISFYFIKDLGAPDALFSINGFSVNILPIVMTLVNCLSCLIYAKGLPLKDKIQLYGMAFIFLILLYNSPAALALYWTMNNVFSCLKNIYYKINYKNKHHILFGIVIVFLILLASFCLIKFPVNTRAKLLAVVLLVFSIFSVMCYIFRSKIKTIINKITYNKLSLPVFLLSVFLIWTLFGLFLPSQLIIASPQEFSFLDDYTNPLIFLFITALQVFGFFVFWPVCFYFLFSDNIKKYFSLFFFAISICLLSNVFLFSGNYGLISIDFIFDNSPVHSNFEYFINLSVMCVLIIAAVILNILKTKKYIPVIICICMVSLFSISFINIYRINSSFNHLKTYYVKDEKIIEKVTPIFKLSKNEKNIVVIMLDRAISVFVPYIFDESPELKEIYSGFVFYPNTVSFNGYTKIGSSALFGGYEYAPQEMNKRSDVTLVEKHNEALLLLPHILSENNFSVCVTDPPYANSNWIGDLSIYDDYPAVESYITDGYYTDFWLKENGIHLKETSSVIIRNMFWYSFLKGLPQIFRNPIYMHGYWCSPEVNYNLRLTLNGYCILDYLPLLTEITEENKNYALIMVNNTTHKSYFLQAPDYSPSLNITNYGSSRFSKAPEYHTTAAAIKRLADWFEFLKRENLYDNTRIILVSDHGPEPNFVTKTDLPFNVDQFNAFLMAKDFAASGELVTDMQFMSNADVPYLALADVIDNPRNPFTGKLITTDAKNEPLYITMWRSTHSTPGDRYKLGLDPKHDYYIHDSIFKKENWVRADKYNE